MLLTVSTKVILRLDVIIIFLLFCTRKVIAVTIWFEKTSRSFGAIGASTQILLTHLYRINNANLFPNPFSAADFSNY